ncbi:MAG: hypothetical protein JWM68_5757 [Verrucomicrobiales bacterium]|nr:hypothetical protein [Verrucomicrobiales bacterium]
MFTLLSFLYKQTGKRAARQAALVPLLQKRHLRLTSREAGNFELTAYPERLTQRKLLALAATQHGRK